MYVCAKYLLAQSLCPVVQTSFLQHLYHYLRCIYLFISHLCVLAAPPFSSQGPGDRGLGSLGFVHLCGAERHTVNTDDVYILSTVLYFLLLHIYSLFRCSQEPSFGFVLLLTSIIHAHADFLSSVGECEWFCKRDLVDKVANLCI